MNKDNQENNKEKDGETTTVEKESDSANTTELVNTTVEKESDSANTTELVNATKKKKWMDDLYCINNEENMNLTFNQIDAGKRGLV